MKRKQEIIEGIVVDCGLKTFPASDHAIFVVAFMNPDRVAQVMSRAVIWAEVKEQHQHIHLAYNLRKGDRVRCVVKNKRRSAFRPAYDLVSINVFDD